jgi:hypothetical protein
MAAAVWKVKGFANATEAVTMKKVMEFAHQCCFTHVILKSNCQMLIRILDRKEHNLTYFGKIVNIQ